MVESLFAGMQPGNFSINRIQHRIFVMIMAKFSKTSILKDICEQLLLNVVIKWMDVIIEEAET